jgi:hypothetical protein
MNRMRNALLSDKSANSKTVTLCVLILVIVTVVGTIIIGDILFKPDDVSPPDSSETDDSTSTPSEPATPDSVPPENATTTEPPEPETPTPTLLQIDLDEAIARNLVQVTITGRGGRLPAGVGYCSTEMILRSTSDQPLEVTVPVGTVLEAQTTGLCNVVLTNPLMVELDYDGYAISYSTSSASLNMLLNSSGFDDELVVSSEPVSVDLGLLLGLSDFQDETFRVQQFAIWTITDNPGRGGYVPIGSYSSNVEKPTEEEISRIRDLFDLAGISADKYKGLSPPLTVDLDEALARNLVRATVSGDSLQFVEMTLESIAEELLDNLLQVAIPVGTVFEAQSSGLQDMVVIESTVFELESVGDILSDLVSVACKSMLDDAPSGDDELVVSSEPVSADLGLLLGLSDFQDETFRVQQFAIWTITDNPTRYEYVNLGTFMYGSGPSDEEMSKIQDLFNSAGISTSKYYALN